MELGDRANSRIVIDPDRAVATCLKPAESGEPGSCLLRLWEVEGKAGPLKIQVHGFSRAFQTDLLERDLHPLTVANGELTLELRALGLAAVRLLP